MAAPLPLPPSQVVCAGLDFGSSGARISLIQKSSSEGAQPEEIYSKQIPFSDYSDPEEWTKALAFLLSDLPAKPEALSLSSTSNSLLAVRRQNDNESASLVPVNVSMYDNAPVLTREQLSRQREALESAEEDAIEGVDFKTPFAKTGGATKVLSLLSSPQTLIHTQSSFILHHLLPSMPYIADWNNLMKLGYDPVDGEYISAVSKCLGPDTTQNLLPSGAPSGTFVGTIDKPSLPALKGCSVYLGSTDSICAFIGALSSQQNLSGPSKLEGLTVTSLGTTLATKMLSKSRVYDASRGVYSHLIPASVLFEGTSSSNLWLAGGASQAGCKILRDLEFSSEELKNLSTLIPPDAVPLTNDLYPLPLNAKGERFPVADDSKESNVNASKYETRLALLTDVLLGIAKNVELEGYKALEELGAPFPSKLITSGGGSNNDQWTAIRSRLFNVPVSRAPPSRDAAFGAALIAYRSHHQLQRTQTKKTRYWSLELDPIASHLSEENLALLLDTTGFTLDDLITRRYPEKTFHVTLAFAPTLAQEKYWKERENEKLSLSVNAIAWDQQVAALTLSPGYKIPENEAQTPHVTLALSNDTISASHSNTMLNNPNRSKKEATFTITGFIKRKID
ncbi:hypothetical protein TrVE_jg13462 [Triparma verrucosa]|uniref:Xylulose kinase n=1 Tax=Triparma verrucosa TaxID=1606542 RepID=A0A9W7FD00_9STRA|nr:hypothetical protein TrVE_jg13462 [Triparma verrucosa]